jgi:hypothetical protein
MINIKVGEEKIRDLVIVVRLIHLPNLPMIDQDLNIKNLRKSQKIKRNKKDEKIGNMILFQQFLVITF